VTGQQIDGQTYDKAARRPERKALQRKKQTCVRERNYQKKSETDIRLDERRKRGGN